VARFINKPITVTLGRVEGWPELAPARFVVLGGRHQTAQVLDCWRMVWTPWWEDPKCMERGPVEAYMWRVRTVKQGVFELVQIGQEWLCYKSYD